jgi:hypothetical protein
MLQTSLLSVAVAWRTKRNIILHFVAIKYVSIILEMSIFEDVCEQLLNSTF